MSPLDSGYCVIRAPRLVRIAILLSVCCYSSLPASEVSGYWIQYWLRFAILGAPKKLTLRPAEVADN